MTLTPADIRDYWGRIRPVLCEHFRFGHPENIKTACESGAASLYVADDDGFVIVAPEINLDNGQRELLVWFVHGKPGAIRRHQAELVEIAKRGGFARLTTRATRDGLVVGLPKLGWQARFIEFTLEIDHG